MTLFQHSLRAAVAAVAVLSACSKSPTPTSTSSTSLDNPNQPVAKYGGKIITLKEVDTQAAGQLKQLDKQKLDLRIQTAEQIAVQSLLKEEAAKVGQSDEQWLKANVDSKIPTPSDDQIKKVFDENKDRMPPGSTLESMREQIINYLGQDQRRQLAMKVLDDLKTKAGFEMLLEEPRVQVEAKGPAKGAEGAKVTIVEFSDFECPFCSKAEESIGQVMEQFGGKVRLVFRHFPLSFHQKAGKAAEAAVCAEEQGKFWEFHKALFANQQKLAIDELKSHATTVGLDAAKFAECLDSGRMKSRVDADLKAGEAAGVSGTPAFFINGKMLSGALPVAEFEKVINAELAKAK